MKSGIYQIRDLCNNKVYIGSTRNLRSRELEHWRSLRNGKHHSPILQNAYCKYGKDVFIFEVLELVTISELLEREQYYIDTHQPEYNIRKYVTDQRVGYVTTLDTRNKQSSARKGKSYHTVEQIAKIRQVHTGKTVSKDTRMKRARAVLQVDPETSRTVQEYYSIQEAFKNTGINNIAGVLRGYQKKAGGFLWKYKEERISDLEMYETKAEKKKANITEGRKKASEKVKKPVGQYDKVTGDLVRSYRSVKDAEIAFNKSSHRIKGNISNCCAGKQKTAYGFIWKFL